MLALALATVLGMLVVVLWIFAGRGSGASGASALPSVMGLALTLEFLLLFGWLAGVGVWAMFLASDVLELAGLAALALSSVLALALATALGMLVVVLWIFTGRGSGASGASALPSVKALASVLEFLVWYWQIVWVFLGSLLNATSKCSVILAVLIDSGAMLALVPARCMWEMTL